MGRLIFSESSVSNNKEVNSQNNILLFPTIASKRIFVRNLQRDYSFKIIDLTGRIHQEGNLLPESGLIELLDMNPGAYLLVLGGDNQFQITKRFLKID